mmetsp:Transcript_31492/g.92201  ORF Transcript_31492/g.92201 Transcript_31492/m.92201 type:complete len:177 (-) Transcript_31492:97-627(-)
MPHGRTSIAQRAVFVQSIDVLPGQLVEWEFQVFSGTADGVLGQSDVAFSLDAFWTSDEPQAHDFSSKLLQRLKDDRPLAMESIEPAKSYNVSLGPVKGSVLVRRPGVMWFRWSNRHSRLRRKLIRYDVKLGEADGAAGGAQGFRDRGRSTSGGWGVAAGAPPAGGQKPWACCGPRA